MSEHRPSLKLKTTLALAAALLSAGCGQATVSPADADRVLQPLLGTQVPPQATEICVSDKRVFNRVVDVRFRTTDAELDGFLRGSKRLDPGLIAGERAIVDTMSTASWWRPGSLQRVRGNTYRWMSGEVHVDCHVMAGYDGGPGVVAYLAIVLEKHRAPYKPSASGSGP